MKLEDLIKLGLDEETANKVVELNNEQLKGFIPKARFDEVNTQKNEYQAKIDELSKSTGTVEELKQQIEATKNEMATKEAEYQERIKNLTIDSALKLAIANNVHDADIVAELLKKDGVDLDENGNIKGLDEKVNALKESKPFLFKQEQEQNNQQNQGFQFQGKIGQGKIDPPQPTGPNDLRSAISEAVFGTPTK